MQLVFYGPKSQTRENCWSSMTQCHEVDTCIYEQVSSQHPLFHWQVGGGAGKGCHTFCLFSHLGTPPESPEWFASCQSHTVPNQHNISRPPLHAITCFCALRAPPEFWDSLPWDLRSGALIGPRLDLSVRFGHRPRLDTAPKLGHGLGDTNDGHMTLVHWCTINICISICNI